MEWESDLLFWIPLLEERRGTIREACLPFAFFSFLYISYLVQRENT